jgi:hypothetical protein
VIGSPMAGATPDSALLTTKAIRPIKNSGADRARRPAGGRYERQSEGRRVAGHDPLRGPRRGSRAALDGGYGHVGDAVTSGKLMNAAPCVTASARPRLGTACSPGEAFARAVTGVDAGSPGPVTGRRGRLRTAGKGLTALRRRATSVAWRHCQRPWRAGAGRTQWFGGRGAPAGPVGRRVKASRKLPEGICADPATAANAGRRGPAASIPARCYERPGWMYS